MRAIPSAASLPPISFFAGVHAERNVKIGERGGKLALVLIGHGTILVCIEELRKEPQ
jgi:hypothetical protein